MIVRNAAIKKNKRMISSCESNRQSIKAALFVQNLISDGKNNFEKTSSNRLARLDFVLRGLPSIESRI